MKDNKTGRFRIALQGAGFPAAAVFFFLLFLAALLPGGCSRAAEEETEKTPLFSMESYPLVDGSTVTIPLSEALASALTGLEVEEVRPHILHNKTHQAYINLIEKRADLIFVTAPSEDEIALAEEAGVTLEVIPVVSEAFVFLVNAGNKVDDLSSDQIRGIYSGLIASWSELGGEEMPIVAYQRPVNSGSQTGFLELVMGSLEPMDPPMEQVIAEMGMLIDAVASYDNQPDAIGYSYYYFVTDMWGSEKVKLLSIDGVTPCPETITAGTYPFNTAYYAVLRADEPEESAARQAVAWLLSEAGQALAEETGYVRIR